MGIYRRFSGVYWLSLTVHGKQVFESCGDLDQLAEHVQWKMEQEDCPYERLRRRQTSVRRQCLAYCGKARNAHTQLSDGANRKIIGPQQKETS
jgi:hypothetical protein